MPLSNELQLELTDAVAILNQARVLPSPQVITLVDHAERKVIGVRETLIEQGRNGASSADHAAALKQVNVALSLLAALEYPTSLERKHLDEACEVLHKAISAEPPKRQAPPSDEQQQTAPVTPLGGMAGGVKVEPLAPAPAAQEQRVVETSDPGLGEVGSLGGIADGLRPPDRA